MFKIDYGYMHFIVDFYGQLAIYILTNETAILVMLLHTCYTPHMTSFIVQSLVMLETVRRAVVQ